MHRDLALAIRQLIRAEIDLVGGDPTTNKQEVARAAFDILWNTPLFKNPVVCDEDDLPHEAEDLP